MLKTPTNHGRLAVVVTSVFGFLTTSAAADELLASNGPLSSTPAAHETGADLVWAVPQGAAAGVSAYATLDYRLAERFEVSASSIDSVVVYGYQQGAIAGPTIDFLGVELWDGQPGQPGSTRVSGDVSTNGLDSAEFTNTYVALHGVSFTTDRPVYALTAANLGWSVGAGEYWLVWSMGGSIDGGPYSPYLGDDADPTDGNALQLVLGSWRPANNRTEDGVQVSLPFEVYGATACAADCDGDGSLTIFDFLCFQNAYSAGESSADCDGDGSVTSDDFTCFQASFMAGCG